MYFEILRNRFLITSLQMPQQDSQMQEPMIHTGNWFHRKHYQMISYLYGDHHLNTFSIVISFLALGHNALTSSIVTYSWLVQDLKTHLLI